MSTSICIALVVIFVVFLCRLFLVISAIHNPKNSSNKSKNDQQTVTVITLGSGGHTSEMLRLISDLGPKFSPKIYIAAVEDEMSREKIRNLHKNDDKAIILSIPRSRKVHQSYFTSVITTIYSCLYSLGVVIKIFPDLVICNGPGTCIPICAAVILLRVLNIKYCKIIFVESICRVETISLSGKILYYFADEFIVQWPELTKKYPRATYLGRLV